MDFDEYEYLEKTADEPQIPNGKDKKTITEPQIDEPDHKQSPSNRKPDAADDEIDDRRSKRRESRSDRHRSREREVDARDADEEGENGDRRSKRRDPEERDRHRSRDREVVTREEGEDGEKVDSKERENGDRRSKRRDREERDSRPDRHMSRDREVDADERRVDRHKSRDREVDAREEDGERRHKRARGEERSDRRERDRERERREKERRSRSHSRIEREREKEIVKERERELEMRERRYKDKKEAAEPEADPERDQRTVFAYQMPLKATERDVYEFFSKAGKVRDVRLIMDRNSRRSKGVGYIEFYDVMSVPMAIALSGHLLLGQPVMVKPSEAEKNLVQSNTTGGGTGGLAGPYGAVDRKLYVGNLHFNMTELQLKQIFEPFGPVELVQLPTDPETGQCKGFGFIQFAQIEHAKAALSLNGKLEICGRYIKVSSVTDHISAQDPGAKAADFDDDDGGGLSLNAQSRAMLMQKLDRTGVASSIVGAIGAPMLNGSVLPHAMNMPMGVVPGAVPALPGLFPAVSEPIGNPSECLLLKNMFDPATEMDPEFDLDIKEDVHEECSNYGRVMHIQVDKNSAGYVYLRFESMEAAMRAQQAMHKRWFARRLISAIFLQPYEYEAKFKGEV